jgi:hypothetical protein
MTMSVMTPCFSQHNAAAAAHAMLRQPPLLVENQHLQLPHALNKVPWCCFTPTAAAQCMYTVHHRRCSEAGPATQQYW